MMSIKYIELDTSKSVGINHSLLQSAIQNRSTIIEKVEIGKKNGNDFEAVEDFTDTSNLVWRITYGRLKTGSS